MVPKKPPCGVGRPTVIDFLFNPRGSFGAWRVGGDTSTLPQPYFDNDFPIVMDTRCPFLLIEKKKKKALNPDWNLSLTTLSISIKIGKDLKQQKYIHGWQESKLVKSFGKTVGIIWQSWTRACPMTPLLNLYCRATFLMHATIYIKNVHGHIVLKNNKKGKCQCVLI